MNVYKIVKYVLDGTILYTKQFMPDYKMVGVKFFDEKGNHVKGDYTFDYTVNPPSGAIDSDEKFFPYLADVIEDLPPGCLDAGLKPKTYKNCVLMTEKHGGYLQFYHSGTQQVLRIAFWID